MISTPFPHCSHSKPDVFLPLKIQGFRAGDADTKLITVIPKQDLLIWVFVSLNPDILFILLHRYIHRYKMQSAGITCHQFYEVFPMFFCFGEGWNQCSSLSSEVSPILQQNHLSANTEWCALLFRTVLFHTSKIYEITALHNVIPTLSCFQNPSWKLRNHCTLVCPSYETKNNKRSFSRNPDLLFRNLNKNWSKKILQLNYFKLAK